MLPERPGARHQRFNSWRPDLDRAAMLPRETWRNRARYTRKGECEAPVRAALPSFFGEDFFCYWMVKGVFYTRKSACGHDSCLTQGSAVFLVRDVKKTAWRRHGAMASCETLRLVQGAENRACRLDTLSACAGLENGARCWAGCILNRRPGVCVDRIPCRAGHFSTAAPPACGCSMSV